MSTATKDSPVTLEQLHAPKPAAVDLAAHEADRKRRQAEIDARREEMLRCLSPQYAAAREVEKEMREYEVSATWLGRDGDDGALTNFSARQTVAAQNENDAWARLCDKIGQWPNRRDAKPTFKKGRRLKESEVAILLTQGGDADDGTSVIPTKTIGAKKKARKM